MFELLSDLTHSSCAVMSRYYMVQESHGPSIITLHNVAMAGTVTSASAAYAPGVAGEKVSYLDKSVLQTVSGLVPWLAWLGSGLRRCPGKQAGHAWKDSIWCTNSNAQIWAEGWFDVSRISC